MEEKKGKGVKRGYCDHSTETATPVAVNVIVNEPGFVVAVGGIPDPLILINSTARVISFALSFPISKIPKNLPRDPTERRRVFFKALKEVRSQIESRKRKTCWVCKQLLPEEYCMVYINVIPPFPSDFNDALAPAFIPSQSIEESEEDDSSYWYLTNKDIVHLRPRFVGVVGGIPQDMKIKDGISFWVPSPKFKYPKMMPADTTEREDAILECYFKGMKSDAFVNAFLQAYIKAKSEAHGLRLASSSWICHNIDQQPPTTPMIEFNMAATPGSHYLACNDRSQGVKYLTLVESPTGCTFLRCNFSDSRELVPLVGVVINEPGIVAAVGGIPNELKIEGAKTFWFRCPILKYSHIKAEDYEDDVAEDYLSGDDMDAKEVEYIKIFREDVVRAYREVCRVSSSSSSTCKQEAEAHSIHPLCLMAEVNILESQCSSPSKKKLVPTCVSSSTMVEPFVLTAAAAQEQHGLPEWHRQQLQPHVQRQQLLGPVPPPHGQPSHQQQPQPHVQQHGQPEWHRQQPQPHVQQYGQPPNWQQLLGPVVPPHGQPPVPPPHQQQPQPQPHVQQHGQPPNWQQQLGLVMQQLGPVMQQLELVVQQLLGPMQQPHGQPPVLPPHDQPPHQQQPLGPVPPHQQQPLGPVPLPDELVLGEVDLIP